MRRLSFLALVIPMVAVMAACAAQPEPLPNGLLLALATFEKGPQGPVPQPATLGVLTAAGDTWTWKAISDQDSNVFHKAMLFEPAAGDQRILTAGGTKAVLKLWKAGGQPDHGGDEAQPRREGLPDAASRTRHDRAITSTRASRAWSTSSAVE